MLRVAMSKISEFSGLRIYVYPREHGTPHIHIFYGGHQAFSIDIVGNRMAGENKLTKPLNKMLTKWRRLRRQELLGAWAAMMEGRTPPMVPPP